MEIRDCNPFFVLSFVYYVSGKNSLYHVCLMYVHVWCFYVVIYYAEINLSIPFKINTMIFLICKHGLNNWQFIHYYSLNVQVVISSTKYLKQTQHGLKIQIAETCSVIFSRAHSICSCECFHVHFLYCLQPRWFKKVAHFIS